MDTKNMEEIYQQVASIIVNIIPEDWKEIYLYAEIREGYKKVFFYYYPFNGGKPIYSLDITELYNVNEDEFDEQENKLYNCFTRLREEFRELDQDEWTNLTFILDNTGKMRVNYGYEDISQISPVEKQDKWETEYLK